MRGALLVLISLPAFAAGPREPFAKAHVSMMVRAQAGDRDPRLADVDVWAEGAKLRARIRGQNDIFWIDGSAAEAVRIVDGKVAEPKRRTLEHALQIALTTPPPSATGGTEKIAGRPCKSVTEPLPAGGTLTRCIWRGLPLSVELKAGTFSFNAAATMVDESGVTVADLTPPPGAPSPPAVAAAGP